MSRNKQGSKTGRRERHIARATALKERKRLTKQRAERYAHLPGQQPGYRSPLTVLLEGTGVYGVPPVPASTEPAVDHASLEAMTRDQLRKHAGSLGLRQDGRKDDLIARIEGSS
jgi:hypothetical protein